MNVIIQMVGKIPATFWGVVVGSFFTLFGVYLANRSSERRLQVQFDNERLLQNREREMSFRKDIYLAVVEAITVGINTLGRFGDTNLPDSELATVYLEKVPAIAKANLIGNEKTARALADLATELGCAFLRLSSERLPLLLLRKDIERIEADIRRHAQLRDGMVELMRHQNIEGMSDGRKFEVLQSNFNFESEQIARAVEEEVQLRKQLFTRQMALLRACHTEGLRINDLLLPALIAARDELELPIDEDVYADIFRQSLHKADQQVEGYLRHLASLSESARDRQSPETG